MSLGLKTLVIMSGVKLEITTVSDIPVHELFWVLNIDRLWVWLINIECRCGFDYCCTFPAPCSG